MSVIDVMKKRCSVRAFAEGPVEKEKLNKILEAARVAPSACNRQPWHFIVIQDEDQRQKLFDGWVGKAPAVIIVCGDHSVSWRRKDGKDHCDIDVAIAVDHMTLQACELGLGTCWVCWFSAFTISEKLDLPEHLEPVALLPVGYPEKTPADPDRHDKVRKNLDEIVSWDGFPKKKHP